MSDTSRHHIQLVLRERPDGYHSMITVMKATADFYGWTRHFKTKTELLREQAGGGYLRLPYRRCIPKEKPGTPIRIGRGKVTRLNQRGLTNVFRPNWRCTLRDLADLGLKTEVDWHWMERPNGVRESRDWWLRLLAPAP